jgi:hypothetical protein
MLWGIQNIPSDLRQQVLQHDVQNNDDRFRHINCNLCEMTRFPDFYDLQLHKLYIHEKNEETVTSGDKCDILQNLSQNVTMSDSTTHQCDICGSVFWSDSDLLNHNNLEHLGSNHVFVSASQ